jgi:murein DD-endopeptidase MepM/ murein hydrolase activator NlpD
MNSLQAKNTIKQRILWFMMIAWLLPALACNFPGSNGKPVEMTSKELHQTLAAQLALLPTLSTQSPPLSAQPPANTPPSPLQTSLPAPGLPAASLTPDNRPTDSSSYFAQAGDTLSAVARRFNIDPGQIFSPDPLPATGFLSPGQPLSFPINMTQKPDSTAILPDSEAINSPTALDFDIDSFVKSAGGFLSTYEEAVNGQKLSGAEIVARISAESSVNPRLLLAFLEYRSGWVFGQPRNPADLSHPLGFYVPDRSGLYQEMVMAATHLNIGYYGWRSGELDSFKYADGSKAAINPWLNPGTVAVQNLFAKFYKPQPWLEALYGSQNFPDLYRRYFGDPWERATSVEPLFTPGMSQPDLELPFAPGERWSLTGGPHAAWNTGSPRGALDFAPVTGQAACSISRAWVTASAPGLVVRSDNSVVAIDLDGDGNEQTGWVIVYLHIADPDRIPYGQQVRTNDRLGHPSCERGQSTGTHVHIARKYDGEWLEADGPLPFILSGWQAKAGKLNYQGTLVKENQQVTASPVGPRTSVIVR